MCLGEKQSDESERSGRAEAKLFFMKKLFPKAVTTAGGTCKLCRRDMQEMGDIILSDTGSGK